MPDDFDLPAALRTLGRPRRVLICPHDDPDPDALASAWAMSRLLEIELATECVIGFEGIIGRAENRAMVRELGIRLRRLGSLDAAGFDGVILVDTQPAATNHSVPVDLPVLACVDHHPVVPASGDRRPAWFDVRPDGETCASIVLGYLVRRGIIIDDKLATAILYALKTDTRDFTREANSRDLEAHATVFPRADMRALGAILNPRLDRRYFDVLHRALRVANSHGPAIEVYLGDLPYPDLVAEMADLFVRRRGTTWCLCGGSFDGQLRLSLRTEDEDAGAGELAQRLVHPLGGFAGGHGMSAGGRIPLGSGSASPPPDVLWRGVVERFLDAIDAPRDPSLVCRAVPAGGVDG